MSIGRGNLPAPADAPPGTTGWIVPAADETQPDAFYRLFDNNGTPIWLRQDARVLYGTDPVLIGDAVQSLNNLGGGAAIATTDW